MCATFRHALHGPFSVPWVCVYYLPNRWLVFVNRLGVDRAVCTIYRVHLCTELVRPFREKRMASIDYQPVPLPYSMPAAAASVAGYRLISTAGAAAYSVQNLAAERIVYLGYSYSNASKCFV